MKTDKNNAVLERAEYFVSWVAYRESGSDCGNWEEEFDTQKAAKEWTKTRVLSYVVKCRVSMYVNDSGELNGYGDTPAQALRQLRQIAHTYGFEPYNPFA